MGSLLRRSDTATFDTRPVTAPALPASAVVESASLSMLEPGATVPGLQNDMVIVEWECVTEVSSVVELMQEGER